MDGSLLTVLDGGIDGSTLGPKDAKRDGSSLGGSDIELVGCVDESMDGSLLLAVSDESH